MAGGAPRSTGAAKAVWRGQGAVAARPPPGLAARGCCAVSAAAAAAAAATPAELPAAALAASAPPPPPPLPPGPAVAAAGAPPPPPAAAAASLLPSLSLRRTGLKIVEYGKEPPGQPRRQAYTYRTSSVPAPKAHTMSLGRTKSQSHIRDKLSVQSISFENVDISGTMLLLLLLLLLFFFPLQLSLTKCKILER
ncbi:protein enabled homolog isoform X3 [Canis lupus familiaris]|uniref:protein enabled homolog isoform X3 n=1 Tax=Canis lupus familiaris TaxID=9615 RepID=UPI0018F70395|nr:protein enabled homolog isoform X3 [Canis lupus familiaris]